MFFVTIFYQTSMTSDPVISDLVASARAAQHGYEKFDQSQVDDVVGLFFDLKLRQVRSVIEMRLIALDISHGSGGAQKAIEYLNVVLE